MDSEYSTYRDGKYVSVPKIDELCLMLKEKFLRQEEDNERLRETNQKLKENVWKEEEIVRLKNENKRLREEIKYSFIITKEENDKIAEWINNREKKYTGAIGGRYEYRFFPTSIGTVGKIIDTINNESFTFSELG